MSAVLGVILFFIRPLVGNGNRIHFGFHVALRRTPAVVVLFVRQVQAQLRCGFGLGQLTEFISAVFRRYSFQITAACRVDAVDQFDPGHEQPVIEVHRTDGFLDRGLRDRQVGPFPVRPGAWLRVVLLGARGAGQVAALGHVHRTPVIGTFGARLADEIVVGLLEVGAGDVAVDDGQVGHFLEAGQVGLDRFLGGVDADAVLVDVVFQLLEVRRLLHAQRRVDVQRRVPGQLLVGGPQRVLVALVAPLGE